MTSLAGLNSLNFFVADVRDGLGPFLGVFLQEEGWSPSEIGFVMTLGGLAGMAATAPMGMLVDGAKAKRLMIVLAALAIIVASGANYFLPSFGFTATAQMLCAIAAAIIGPAIAGITLGIVGQRGFAKQLGRNEAFNHGGNVTAALLSGVLGYFFGLGAVFALMAAMALGSIVCISRIDPKDIDHNQARGLNKESAGKKHQWRDLFKSKPLIVLACTLLLFHLANAAMLPILGQELVARGAGDPSVFTSATIIIAQLTMIPMALLASRIAQKRGYWIVFVAALAVLPVRGLLAGFIDNYWVLVPVQILDGVGAGLLGVAVPGLVARLLNGSGHINAGLGLVMTVQGVGSALSTTLAGYVAEHVSYNAAFITLAGVSVVALLLWLFATPLLGEAGGKYAPA